MHSNRKRRTISIAALCLVLSMATPVALAGDPSNMAERVTQWETAFNAGDDAAVAAMYAEDGARLPYQAPAVQGREAIVENIRASRERGIAKVDLELVGTETQGNLAWAHGTYVLMTADGTVAQKGKWMNVSKKIGGKWMIQADIWNTDAPE